MQKRKYQKSLEPWEYAIREWGGVSKPYQVIIEEFKTYK